MKEGITMAESSQTQEIQIPDIIAELLEPITPDNPTGSDASNEEAYFKLDMEIGKVTPDYKVCIELADELLKNKSKDLRIAAWNAFALYRTQQIEGFKNGLILIFELLKNFGDDLFPSNPKHKSKAIQFLNSARFFKLLDREKVNEGNAKVVVEIGNLFGQIHSECKEKFPDNPPTLTYIEKVIKAQVEEAKKISDSSAKVETDIKEKKPAEGRKPEAEKTVQAEETRKEQASIQPTQPPEPVSARDVNIGSEKDAIVTFKKTILSFFEEESHGNKNRKVPNQSYIFGISRALIWGKMITPPNKENVTQIAAPNQTIQNKIQEFISNSDWDKLIPIIEINFLNEDSGFKYWLDVQRFVTNALEKKGGIVAKSAEDVKFHLAKLITKNPNLPNLQFKDKTQFADQETLSWLDEEIKTAIGGGKGDTETLPLVVDESYESITKEFETVCAELPENFEINLEKMQNSVAGEVRRKGRFLRMLNLANFCMQAKQYNLAKIVLRQLLNKIDEYKLIEWESPLCVSVWQTTYLVNLQLLKLEQEVDGKLVLEKQQKELFSKIGNYNGLLAIKLTNESQKGGK